MGALSSWPLDGLVRAISSVFGVTNFVETGTFMGDSSAWAAGVFPNVVTIEKRQDFRDAAAQRHGHLPIRFLTGDSADLMPGIVDELTSPALFWLDGMPAAATSEPAMIVRCSPSWPPSPSRNSTTS